MIPDEVVQDVLARADIVQVVGDYVQLKRAGSGSLKGLCPFHDEKTPSFHVTPSKGLYYCFGCGEGGSAVDFVRQMEGLSFPEAIERLGQRFGVEVVRKGVDRKTHRRRRELRERLYDINELARRFFSSQLGRGRFPHADAYVEQRGLDEEVVEVFKLGFAPDSWDALVGEIERLGKDIEVAEKAGLVVRRDGPRGGHYDRFRNRLMFPVIDERGQLVAFGGRTLDPEVDAKYVNSPESPIYTKGRSLYGIHAARDAIRKSGQTILVEGNVDVIKMYQAGFRQTVAPMGTSLTPEQAKLIKRFASSVVVLFDGDTAGQRAAQRAIPPLLTAEIDARVALMPAGEDPDSFLATFGPDGMREILDDARPLAGWAVSSACEEVLQHPVELRHDALSDLADLLSSFPSEVVRRHYALESARHLGYQLGELRRLLSNTRSRPPRRSAEGAERGLTQAAPFPSIQSSSNCSNFSSTHRSVSGASSSPTGSCSFRTPGLRCSWKHSGSASQRTTARTARALMTSRTRTTWRGKGKGPRPIDFKPSSPVWTTPSCAGSRSKPCSRTAMSTTRIGRTGFEVRSQDSQTGGRSES